MDEETTKEQLSEKDTVQGVKFVNAFLEQQGVVPDEWHLDHLLELAFALRSGEPYLLEVRIYNGWQLLVSFMGNRSHGLFSVSRIAPKKLYGDAEFDERLTHRLNEGFEQATLGNYPW